MQITLTAQELESIFHTALCDGLYLMSDYSIEIQYSDDDYVAAKTTLLEANPGTQICFEDILMQILKSGGNLTAVDMEGSDTYTINLVDVHENIPTAPYENLLNIMNEEYDCFDADVILQTVFFGEVTFG